MKKRIFDLIVIISIAILVLIFVQLELEEKYSKFALIPILAFYYLGQYAERKFRS